MVSDWLIMGTSSLCTLVASSLLKWCHNEPCQSRWQVFIVYHSTVNLSSRTLSLIMNVYAILDLFYVITLIMLISKGGSVSSQKVYLWRKLILWRLIIMIENIYLNYSNHAFLARGRTLVMISWYPKVTRLVI